MYQIKLLQSVHHDVPDAEPDHYTSQITGSVKDFESLTMTIGVITAAFPNVEITIQQIKEEK